MTPETDDGYRRLADGIAPDYHGRGFANLGPSLLRHFGVTAERPSLDEDVLPPNFADAERVVVVLVDGMGWDQFQRSKARERYRHAAPMTSVLPSTTAAALATLASGVPPAEHGFLGYRTLMPRLGAVVNMVRMRPHYSTGNVFDHGVRPETVFPYRVMVELLAEAGVRVGVVTRNAFVMSPLSQLTYGGVPRKGYVGMPDMLQHVRTFMDQTRGERAYLEVYWDEVDAIAHEYGPDSASHDGAVDAILDAVADALGPHAEDGRTCVIVTADHGHVQTRPEDVRDLNDAPEIMDHLVLPPTGEGRFAYLHVCDGTKEKVRKAVEEAWPGEFTLLDAADVVAEGHFGPLPHHPELQTRVGTLIAVPRGNRKLVYAPTPDFASPPLIGNHGGVQRGEMLVPLAAL